MNKLKFLYDVVKTMQAQENLKGSLLVEATKEQTAIFTLESQFAKIWLPEKGSRKSSWILCKIGESDIIKYKRLFRRGWFLIGIYQGYWKQVHYKIGRRK
jgi:hypothetical protein